MKIHYVTYLAIGLFLMTNCTKSQNFGDSHDDTDTSIYMPPTGTNTNYKTTDEILKHYKLVWNDEFDEKDLDNKKWNYRALGTKRHYATVSAKTISVEGDSVLVIRTMKDKQGNYLIGEVGTQHLYETTYGYFECKAKMNKSLGPHVAFWLQAPTMGKTDDNPAVNGAEVDIFEYHRKTPALVYHNIHWNGYGSGHKSTGVHEKIPDIGTGFHVFGLLWTKNSYTFYVDGKRIWQTQTAVSRRSEYMILSTELTGWGGDPDQGKFPDSVVYDYVRVYKPK